MRLSVVAIADPSVPNRERVHLSVVTDTDLTYYILFSSFMMENGLVSAGGKAGFWFPSHIVKAGDNVVVYTGTGMPTTNIRADGGTNHFFYWGMPRTLFNVPASCVVLGELNAWLTQNKADHLQMGLFTGFGPPPLPAPPGMFGKK